ncbi:zinc ABC transporter substrate-binding protein [Staphylococcus sp. SQ8-PEA]|uniref:Zinc ABC transporter substrate-binding protein n=1 Tax=Staphylococcus marylandisciuri TaxID=2981529 RepID=A0ABT2QSF7_9STAP|nr:zinc ABC transporter substrate-binding protein [Staphylococcus marylandisciuri]MCU5746905.1 zinc ABC transporter substrate-binding protein [Staphylococcus marylandisciuri]
MRKIITLLLIAALFLGACGGDSSKESHHDKDHKLKVVTTNSILFDMVKEIGGDHVEVHSIVPVGQDPHEYEVKPKDIKALTDADVILYNGLNLETGNGWFRKALAQAGKSEKDKSVVAVSNKVKPNYLKGAAHKDINRDPHAWLSLTNGIKYVVTIQNTLINFDKDHKSDYQEKGDKYKEKLDKLNKESHKKFRDIPKDRRNMITSEGAFKYFAQEYHINAGYIWEINTEKQGTPKQMEQAIKFVKNNKVKNLLVETSVDTKSMESLSEETNRAIYGKVFTDSIGKKGSRGDSYYKMMKSNIDTVHGSMAKQQ